MAVQPISFNDDVLSWVKTEAKRTGHTISFMVNYFCQEARQKQLKERPEMISCPRHPGSSYSSKLLKCPLCAEDETLREIEFHDASVRELRSSLTKELHSLDEIVSTMATQINSLDVDTEEGKIKQDKLNVEFDKLSSKRNEIRTQLAELN